MILTHHFREIVSQQFQLHPDFFQVEDEAIEDFARDAADEAISNIRWHLALGDCYRLDHISRESNSSKSDLEFLIERGELLALEGKFDTFFPVWQFQDVRGPLLEKVVQDVLKIFHSTLGRFDYRPEYVISWACTPQPELDGNEPRHVIAEADFNDRIRKSAAIAARSLTQ
ncbi:hypothetical protein ATKI12_6924 [Kitasatospora sp. Ki12]